MNKLSLGLSILEMGVGVMSSRAAKRQALRDKYDKMVEEQENEASHNANS